MSKRQQAMVLAAILLLVGGSAWAQGDRAPNTAAANVRRFGAVGDGKADDTAALQKAVEAGGGVIRLPKGVYRITKPIVIELDKIGYTSICGDGVAQIVMAGPGPALRFVGTHFKSADPGGFAPAVWERQRMPLVDGVAIEGDHPDALGIEATGTMELTITRVHIRKVLHCIHLVGSNRNLLVSDCHLYENRGIGIFYDNVSLHQSNLVGCHISYNDGGGIVSRAGNVRNIQIAGCDLESNMGADRPPAANILIDCSGSAEGTGEVAITGCTIQHNHPAPDSANIRILGRSQDSPKLGLVREGHVTITGNVLSDVQVNVHLRDCRGVTLTGNTFWMGFAHNLLLEDCSNLILGPNNFDRNPRYAYGDCLEARNSLVVRRCADCTFTGLHMTNVWREPAGLRLENCRRMNLTNCTILDCDNVGLLLTNVTNSRVSDCLIRDDREGASSASLVVTGGRGNLIAHNLLGTAPRIPETAARAEGNVHP